MGRDVIAIVDYGMGNLRSVEKGFRKVGVEARIVTTPSAVEDASGIVLPGVGAFRDCVRNLTDAGLTEAVVSGIGKGKPFLGICLGLQVLFSESEEFGRCTGLGVFRGKVARFPRGALKVPHMGWNRLSIKRRPPLLNDIPDGGYFYFVHSYYVEPDRAEDVLRWTSYGSRFCSIASRDKIWGAQFHPEKSQDSGKKLLHNFLAIS